MLIFREFFKHYLIKIYTRITHQTATNYQNFPRKLAYAPEPLAYTCNFNK